MLKLYTFGSVYLGDDAGQPMAPAAGQRRTLALLSALAVAGDSGLSRDKIVGLLWPESDSERARHSLTQTLYLARRGLRRDDVLILGQDVRLNRERITSDVQDLEAALDAGDYEKAVAEYGGPFLDGFFLPGSTEFEDWVTIQRARFEGRVVDAHERLASQAAESGDQRSRVEWRKRIAALRPLDSATAVQLMLALAAAGDRAGALQHARLHVQLLRDQLDLSPDPDVTNLAAELREAPIPSAATWKRETRSEEVNSVVSADEAVASLEETTELHVLPPTALGPHQVWVPRRNLRSRAGQLAVAALALVGLGIVLGRGRDSPPELQTLPIRQQVVVAPFRIAGASRSLEYLGEGLVELLSTRLAEDSAARSVDAGAVLGAWRRAGLTNAAEVPRDTVVRMATRLGAERVVIGSVVGTSARAVVSASVVSVPAGTVHGQATVEGPADSITSLVDQLAARLLTSQAGEDVRLAERMTSSLPALRAFLDGQAAYRESDYSAALRAYARSLELDSTFALGALRMAITAERLNDGEQQRRAIVAAWNVRDKLNTGELAQLTALAGPRYPAPSSSAEHLAAWEQVLALTPDRAEAWFELGARLFRDGAALGLPNARARAATAFQRALSLDSTFHLARQHLIQLTVREPSGLELAELTRHSGVRDSLGPLSPFLQWRIALARQDTLLLQRMSDTLARLGPLNLRTIAMASQHDAIGLAHGARAVELMVARATRPAEQLDATLALHSLRIIQGKPAAALEATTRLLDSKPRTHAHLRLRMLDALYAEGDSVAADNAAQELGRLLAADLAASVSAQPNTSDACVLAQWRLARADTTGLRSHIALLRQDSMARPLDQLSAAPLACAELLDAGLAAKTRGRAALAHLRRLDSLAVSTVVAGDAGSYAHLFIARLYRDLNEPDLALAAIRRRPYMAGWPRYLATAWREEGSLAEATGDTAAALAAYQRLIALRPTPEPPLQQQLEEIQQRIARLALNRGTPSTDPPGRH